MKLKNKSLQTKIEKLRERDVNVDTKETYADYINDLKVSQYIDIREEKVVKAIISHVWNVNSESDLQYCYDLWRELEK